MNKKELIHNLALKTHISKTIIKTILDELPCIVAESLSIDEEVRIDRLGVFSITKRKAMKGTNLLDGVDRNLEETVYPSFRASTYLKKAVKHS